MIGLLVQERISLNGRGEGGKSLSSQCFLHWRGEPLKSVERSFLVDHKKANTSLWVNSRRKRSFEPLLRGFDRALSPHCRTELALSLLHCPEWATLLIRLNGGELA